MEQNCYPVHPGRISSVARVTGAHGELADARIVQQSQRTLRQNFGTALRVRDDFSIVVLGREQTSVRMVLFGQRAGGRIKIRRRERNKLRKARLLPHLPDGVAHQSGALLRGIRRYCVPEILHDV